MIRQDKVRRALAEAVSGSGRRALAARLATRVSGKIPPDLLQAHLLPQDVVSCPPLPEPSKGMPSDQALRVGWMITPPTPGSGGHTTAFRMVKALEDAGHSCELVLYDAFGGDRKAQARVFREHWPELRARVRSADDGLNELDACVATGWQTAHALARRSTEVPLHRFYFIQDYEPFFYPRGFEYALAERTYSFGFNNIALGFMVGKHVAALGVEPAIIPFGCDTTTYSLLNTGAREGVTFYAKPGANRRGFLLAQMALEELHHRRPDVPIHIYGTAVPPPPFAATRHGRLTPGELNQLYNRTFCGLGMSFTNISLVVGEMLASGCIPVVNDSPDARADMDSPYVAWAEATPQGVVDALIKVLDDPPVDVRAVSASVSGWTDTGRQFVEAVEQVAYDC